MACEIDPTVPHYDYDYQRELSNKCRFLGLNIHWGLEYSRRPPQKRQVTLFPTLDEIIEPELSTLWKHGKGKGTQIRWISRKYAIPIKDAKKAVRSAKARLKQQLLYEDYIHNREYFDWLDTPEYYEYCRRFLANLNAENERINRDFEARIADGKEHVIRIDWLDEELNNILDYSTGYYEACQCPMSWMSQRMTRHDFDILMDRGLIEVFLGNPETLGNYEFAVLSEEKPVPEYSIPCCTACGIELGSNVIGLNKKLGAKDESHYKCYQCLGITTEEADNLIEYYKSTGCTMFG